MSSPQSAPWRRSAQATAADEDAERVPPPGTTSASFASPAAAAMPRTRSAWPSAITTSTSSIASTASKASNVCWITGLPATSMNCLGTAAPIRRPVPPASTAAMIGGRGPLVGSGKTAPILGSPVEIAAKGYPVPPVTPGAVPPHPLIGQ
jgi:hypothetical protein